MAVRGSVQPVAFLRIRLKAHCVYKRGDRLQITGEPASRTNVERRESDVRKAIAKFLFDNVMHDRLDYSQVVSVEQSVILPERAMNPQQGESTMPHVLFVVNGYATMDDPVLGAKFRVQARTLRDLGCRAGVLAVNQRTGERMQHSSADGSLLIADEDDGIPIYRDYAWQLLPGMKHLDKAADARVRIGMAARAIEPYRDAHGLPDIIHAHGAKWSGCVAACLRDKFRIPYVLTEHMSSHHRKLTHKWQRPIFEEAYRKSKRRLMVSHALGSRLQRAVGQAVTPWSAMPNVLDPLFAEAEPTPAAASDQPFRFLNLGRMDPVKGQDDLLKAFASAFRGDPSVRLTIGGDGEMRRELEALSNRLEIHEQVEFPGRLEREQVVEAMQQASAYVLSSHEETFAIPLVEATALGKPVIATRCGGPEEIVDETNGVLVKPRRPRELSRAMQWMRQNVQTFDPAEIRRRCLEQYSAASVMGQCLELYNKVLDR